MNLYQDGILTNMHSFQVKFIHMLIDLHSLIVMNVDTNHVPFQRFKRISVCSGIQSGLNGCLIGDKNERMASMEIGCIRGFAFLSRG